MVVQRWQLWSIADKRWMVEATLVPGASVARVARTGGSEQHYLFGWQTLPSGPTPSAKPGVKLLASGSAATPVGVERSCVDFAKPYSGTIHLELRHPKVLFEGGADTALVRVLLQCLQA